MERKTTRQIGYFKQKEVLNNTVKAVINEPPKENKVNMGILEWINTHSKFKWSTMCLELGIDKGNFQRMLKSGKLSLSKEKIKLIELQLKKYGYEK